MLVAVRASLGFTPTGEGGDTQLWFWLGIGLFAVGVVTFFVLRWMAKRGH